MAVRLPLNFVSKSGPVPPFASHPIAAAAGVTPGDVALLGVADGRRHRRILSEGESNNRRRRRHSKCDRDS